MSELQPALDALDDCRAALTKLDRLCCEPGRSPAMAALSETLESSRSAIGAISPDAGSVDEAIARLEDAGAQAGRLQVGCCAPARLPLYTKLLEGLSKAQLTINASAGRAH